MFLRKESTTTLEGCIIAEKSIRVVQKKDREGVRQMAAEVGFPNAQMCMAAYRTVRSNLVEHPPPLRFCFVAYPAPAMNVETKKVMMLVHRQEGKEVGLLQTVLDEEMTKDGTQPIQLSMWADGMGPHCFVFATLHSDRFARGKTKTHFVAGFLGGEKVMKDVGGDLWAQIGLLNQSAFYNRHRKICTFRLL